MCNVQNAVSLQELRLGITVDDQIEYIVVKNVVMNTVHGHVAL